jgi:hypothetical protein
VVKCETGPGGIADLSHWWVPHCSSTWRILAQTSPAFLRFSIYIDKGSIESFGLPRLSCVDTKDFTYK